MAGGDSALEDIEAHVAYNEKTIAELSEVVITQGREIDRLKADLRRLELRLERLAEGEADLD